MPPLTHGKNILPATNYVYFKPQMFTCFLKQRYRRYKSKTNEIYLHGFVVIHKPPFMILTVRKTVIMLPVIANLEKKLRKDHQKKNFQPFFFKDEGPVTFITNTTKITTSQAIEQHLNALEVVHCILSMVLKRSGILSNIFFRRGVCVCTCEREREREQHLKGRFLC